MDYQVLFNLTVAIAGGAVGWVVRLLWDSNKEMHASQKELTDKVSAVELLVAGKYITRHELGLVIGRLEGKLDQIFSKLDQKVDKG